MFLKKKREKNNSIVEIIIPSTLVLGFTMVWPYFGMNCVYNFKN